ncbi:MAG TPA: diguanylate cyclase, partial [Povalibacter sp.]|nr:diguanylate cyclase [Povalibacter sp.]
MRPSSLARRMPTRVESRTLLLFVTCALLPVVAFALFGLVTVDSHFRNLAQQQLDTAAKNYGLVVYDRVQQVDQQLTGLAQRYLQGELATTTIESLDDDRMHVTASATALSPAESPSAVQISRHLAVSDGGTQPDVTLQIAARDGRSEIRLSARLNPEYLWNSDALLPPVASLCVSTADDTMLNCASNSGATPQAHRPATTPDEPLMTSTWALFLNTPYGVAPWTVRLWLPESTALQALHSFRWILPLTAALSVAVALLVGSIFIRHSHAPLRALTEAARRIGRRRFSQPIDATSHDEYGGLARSFNRMAQNLRSQFDLLAVMARVDHAILSHTGTRPAMRYLLRRLPRLLGCPAAAMLLPRDDGDFELSIMTTRDARIRRSILSGAQIDCSTLGAAGPHRRTAAAADTASLLAHFADAGITRIVLQPIVVKQNVRGYLIASEDRPHLRSTLRRLHDIARRLAVAIGNDDWERELWRQAHTDSLTSLSNRPLLRQRLAQLLRTDGTPHRGAVIFMDLDRFKSVNDSLGHTLGDQLLQQVAARLQAQVPPHATLARFGGDEFVVVQPDAGIDEARDLAARLLGSLHDPCQLQETRYVAQASAGIALYPDHGTDVDTLLKSADIALYRAKAGGRGRLCFFDGAMTREMKDRLLLEDRLREAIRREEVCNYFQPKLDCNGNVVGVEALARWSSPQQGMISPGQFIPLAEETGLVVPMGELLLRQVCRQLRDWRDRGIPVDHVAVNISMVQMRDPGFADFVLRCLAEQGLSGDCLEVELTESLFAENRAAVARQLDQLVQADVR